MLGCALDLLSGLSSLRELGVIDSLLVAQILTTTVNQVHVCHSLNGLAHLTHRSDNLVGSGLLVQRVLVLV